MKNCEACGRSHHLHSENDLSNCLVWACDDVRRLRAEVDRLMDIVKQCPRCLVALKIDAVDRQDFEAAAEYRRLIDTPKA